MKLNYRPMDADMEKGSMDACRHGHTIKVDGSSEGSGLDRSKRSCGRILKYESTVDMQHSS